MVAKNATNLAKLKDKVVKGVKSTLATMRNITAGVEQVRSDIESKARAIESGIDELAGTPVLLAESIVGLARTPARMSAGIQAKIDGYAGLMADSINAIIGLPPEAVASVMCNLIGNSIAMTEAVTVGDLTSRAGAIEARNTLDASISQAQTAIESAQNLGYVANPSLLAALANLKSLAENYLLNAAYSLPAEKIMRLASATFPLDLSYTLTGSPDNFAEIAELNGWGGDMLFVLPVGTEVRYYA
jgi:hypothetical protein